MSHLIENVVPPTLPQKNTAIISGSTLITGAFAADQIGTEMQDEVPETQRATPAQIVSKTEAAARMLASLLTHFRAAAGYFEGQSQSGLLSV